MDDIKPWYQSKTVWGAVITLASMAAALAGIEVSDPDRQALADFLVVAGGAVGGILSLVGRLVARGRIA